MAIRTLKFQDVKFPTFKYDKRVANAKVRMNPMDLSSHSRAREALEFGMNMHHPEFNIYVIGDDRTGRMDGTKRFLESYIKHKPTPPDWVYLNNFKQTHKPLPFQLNAGQGIVLKQYMRHFVVKLEAIIINTLESSELAAKIQAANDTAETIVEDAIETLRQYALSHDLDIRQTEEGTVVVMAEKNGKPQDFDKLPPVDKKRVEKAYEEIRTRLHDIMQEAQQKNALLMEQIEDMRKSFVDERITALLNKLRKKFGDILNFDRWVSHLRSDILEHLVLFERDDEHPLDRMQILNERYGVNLLVDHSDDACPRVVLEPNPTYENIFGQIKYRGADSGGVETNVSMIRAGSLHRANGGVLILRADALAQEPLVWEYLKSALRDREIRIEELHRSNSLPLMDAPEPLAIPLDIQIVLVGAPRWYYGFFFQDPDFQTYFKVRADIDPDMAANVANCNVYAKMIQQFCHEKLKIDCEDAALQVLLGYCARWAGERKKLASQYEILQDLIVEAATFSRARKGRTITVKDVEDAYDTRHVRNAWMEERIQDTIKEKIIDIQTHGSVVGQINGLTVLPMEMNSFGTPSRITARTYMGSEGVLNIERSVDMGGPIQQKGAFIVDAYLKGTFGQDFPVSFSGSITFEQNYGGVEGDSASIAEVCSLISSLSGVPLRQDIGITGSMNQLGLVQSIGGVVEKIEGFYKCCKNSGLTKTQGVIIPKANEGHIILRSEVARAIKTGRFHLWSVETVEEALELLTGLPARGKGWDQDSLYGRIYHRLKAFDTALHKDRHLSLTKAIDRTTATGG